MKKVSGKNFKIVETKRREGDSPVLICGSGKAETELGWQPKNPILAARSAELWLQIDRDQEKYI